MRKINLFIFSILLKKQTQNPDFSLRIYQIIELFSARF